MSTFNFVITNKIKKKKNTIYFLEMYQCAVIALYKRLPVAVTVEYLCRKN